MHAEILIPGKHVIYLSLSAHYSMTRGYHVEMYTNMVRVRYCAWLLVSHSLSQLPDDGVRSIAVSVEWQCAADKPYLGLAAVMRCFVPKPDKRQLHSRYGQALTPPMP